MAMKKTTAAALVALALTATGAHAQACSNRGDLDERFCDEDKDLIADLPKDPKQWQNPATLVFSYTPVEDPAVYENVFEELEQQGRDAIAATSVKPHRITVKRALDMRYVGQEHAVTVDLPLPVFRKQDRRAIKTHFDEVHLLRYGTSATNERAEIVSMRATVAGLMKKPPQEKVGKGTKTPPKVCAPWP